MATLFTRPWSSWWLWCASSTTANASSSSMRIGGIGASHKRGRDVDVLRCSSNLSLDITTRCGCCWDSPPSSSSRPRDGGGGGTRMAMVENTEAASEGRCTATQCWVMEGSRIHDGCGMSASSVVAAPEEVDDESAVEEFAVVVVDDDE
jgi:hypothetical protein